MSKKIFKKIVGLLGYKLVEKNLNKNRRFVNSKSFLNLNFILKKVFKDHKINCLIQIGANDGQRFDELNKFIKEYKTKSVLVEPIIEYFEELKSQIGLYFIILKIILSRFMLPVQMEKALQVI